MITLELTVQEINQLLQVLALRPYQDVFQLISKIQVQAEKKEDLTDKPKK